jgi:hypothetical protein
MSTANTMQRNKEAAAGRRAAGLSWSGPRMNAAQLEARLSEIPDDTRDLTGRMFGDPLPSRSALAQRAAQGRTLRPARS